VTATVLAATTLISACADGQPRTRDGKLAKGALASAINACSKRSKAERGDPAKPETWGRSEYDSCMAGQANKTQPANEEICREARGLTPVHNNAARQVAQCILEIL